MIGFCNSIHQFIPHQDSAKILSETLMQSWREIKNLIMGKAIGLHRIISSTGSRLQKEWVKRFNIDVELISKIKKEIKKLSSQQTPTCTGRSIKRKFSTSSKGNIKFKRVRRNQPNTHPTLIEATKACSGITCDGKHKSWYPNSNFSSNNIRINQKQCQRCSRFMTAFRKNEQLLKNIIQHDAQHNIDELFSFASSNSSQSCVIHSDTRTRK